MENENKDVDFNNEVDTTEETTVESNVDTEQETTQDKPAETLEAKRARLQRQLAQVDKKLGLDVKKEEQKISKSVDFDLGEKAFLIANGVKGSDEVGLAKRLQRETGKDIESLLETAYFQQELKALREDKATSDAIPKGAKRSSQSSVDSVEYWIAKGELPPASEVELRRKVVNAEIAKEKNKGVFYNS